MSPETRSNEMDQSERQVQEALEAYQCDHPGAEIVTYRQNNVSIRIRIVDPDFADLDRVEREDLVWRLLEGLPDDVRADITMLVLITPDERGTSLANLEFDKPIPSRL